METKTLHFKDGTPILIDAEDFDRVVALGRWYPNKKDVKRRYACHQIQNPDGSKGSLLLHRFILNITDPNIQVDHINGDKLDNRKSNLRTCHNSQNQVNRPKNSNNKSGFKGVIAWPDGRWRATICKDFKKRHLGLFDTPEEAARAYDRAALELYGEFAHLNFP